MKKPVGTWMLFVLVGTTLLAGVFVLASRKTTIDYSDNPALLVQVSASGIVTLDTYNGQISAPLANVKLEDELRLFGRGTEAGSRGST